MAILLALSAAENSQKSEQINSLGQHIKQPGQRSFVAYFDDDGGSRKQGFWIRAGNSNDLTKFMQKNTHSAAVGWTAQQQDGYYNSGSLSPNVTATSHSSGSSAQGYLASLGSGFRNSQFSFGLGASYGEFNCCQDSGVKLPAVF